MNMMSMAMAESKGLKEEEEERSTQRRRSDLPAHLMRSILSNLFFATPHLMYFHKKTDSYSFFDPMWHVGYQTPIPELADDAEVRFSKFGWLLVSRGDRTLFFFDVFTKTRIDLPDTPEDQVFYTMCFSSPPTSPDCLVLGFDGVASVQICTLRVGKDEVWTCCGYEFNRGILFASCSPVLCNGLYYFLGHAGNLGVFNPKKKRWTVFGEPVKRLAKAQQRYIVESDGDLFLVFVACGGTRVHVLKIDLKKGGKKAWREVRTLGDRVFYVCSRTSFSEKAAVRGSGDKIYFPRFYGDNGVFYSLATRKFHCGDYSRADLYGTKEMKNNCTWVKPMLYNSLKYCNDQIPAYSRHPLAHGQPHLWLLFCDGKSQTFFSVLENRFYARSIPEMAGKYLCTTNYGWLVLLDDDTHDFFLFNPGSMEKVQLPNLKSFRFEECILSSPPSDPNCHVMFIESKGRSVMFCHPGDDEYVEQEFQSDNDQLGNATTFQGRVYCLTVQRKALVVVDFVTGDSTVRFRELIAKDLGKMTRPETVLSNSYLVGSDKDQDDLFFVYKTYLGLDAWEVADFIIFRADFSTKEWVRVKSIGDERTFFIEPRGCTCFYSSSAEAGTRGNCIYFTQPVDKNLYVFDLDDQSISVSLPCPIVSTDPQSYHYWVSGSTFNIMNP